MVCRLTWVKLGAKLRKRGGTFIRLHPKILFIRLFLLFNAEENEEGIKKETRNNHQDG